MEYRNEVISVDYINSLLGISLSEGDIANLLTQMSLCSRIADDNTSNSQSKPIGWFQILYFYITSTMMSQSPDCRYNRPLSFRLVEVEREAGGGAPTDSCRGCICASSHHI